MTEGEVCEGTTTSVIGDPDEKVAMHVTLVTVSARAISGGKVSFRVLNWGIALIGLILKVTYSGWSPAS